MIEWLGKILLHIISTNSLAYKMQIARWQLNRRQVHLKYSSLASHTDASAQVSAANRKCQEVGYEKCPTVPCLKLKVGLYNMFTAVNACGAVSLVNV